MHARSALFDVYGDHLRARGGEAPVAALVGLLEPLGITAPAVRTAVSRMVRQDWLSPVRIGPAAGYALTPRAAARLDVAARRIYRTRDLPWDDHWHVVVTQAPAARPARERLRNALTFLGYAPLSADTWISPRPSDELDALLAAEEVTADRFRSLPVEDPGALARRAWDLDAIAASYERWLVGARGLVHDAGVVVEPRHAFAVRSALVHEWRKFLFTDPALPRALLPQPWPGEAAAAFFDTHAERLLPLATRFVDGVLAGDQADDLVRTPLRPHRPRGDAVSPVRTEVEDGVATVTLDRPDALNALDVELKIALRDTLAEIAADDSVRAVVLTGAGRAFCVGQDLREHATNLRDLPVDEVWATVPEHYSPIATLLATMPKPVIAAVNGVAAGAGASIAFACDLRVVADTAGFNLAFTSVGLSCDTGASWTLQRIVGRARALELLLMPSTVSAEDALRLGLATTVVPAGTLAESAAELARRLAGGATRAYAAVKDAVTFAAGHDLVESLAHEGELMASTGATQDHRDAVASFLAKERPEFHNH